MALYKYFRPADALPSTNEAELPLHVVKEVNDEIKELQKKGKKRGEYQKLPPEDKLTVAKYACEHGVAKAVQHFKGKKLKNSSVSDWKKLYEKELKDRRKFAVYGEEVVVSSLPVKQCGRPPLLGAKCDTLLKKLIVSMRSRGSPVGTAVVCGVGRGIMLKHERASLEEFGGTVRLNKEWAKSVLRRLGYTKRRGNSKSKILPENFEKIKEQFLIDIKSVVKMEDIPGELILNWDQTAMKIVPSSAWTMEKKGSKRVEIAAVDDKRQITALFTCSLAGKFLSVQLIYKGTTTRCLPKNVPFPKDWHLTYTENHWSNTGTMVDYVNNILVPYVVETRKKLGLSQDYPALVMFDVFKGQLNTDIFDLLDANNIIHVIVPANTTDKLQPLDLSVNKPAKDFMKTKFQGWYGEVIRKQLEDQVEVEVDMRLSVMKPLVGNWIIDMYHYFQSKPNIIINGFHAAGIVDTLASKKIITP